MSILHIVRSNGFNDDRLQQCLNLLAENDKLLLIDDGVYNVSHPTCASLTQAIFAIDSHCQARNIVEQGNVKQINIEEFVNLSEHAEKVITWQ